MNITSCLTCGKKSFYRYGIILICKECSRIYNSDNSRKYENICRCCHKPVSNNDVRCGKCGWYICPICGAHKYDCNGIIENLNIEYLNNLIEKANPSDCGPFGVTDADVGGDVFDFPF